MASFEVTTEVRRRLGLRRLTPNWFWLKDPEWDKHKFEKPIP
jgi:hypothetical protein